MTTAIVTIPLNKLIPSEGNVRKTHNKAFIDELAASIKAHGLQQNLVVKPDGKKFAVIAGGQRLKAMLQLADADEIKPTFPVPCKIATGDLDPSEISLLENVLRENMHPADEFEAFRDLVDKGVPVPDIAARLSCSASSWPASVPPCSRPTASSGSRWNRSWVSPCPTITRRKSMCSTISGLTTAAPARSARP
jgi:ParB family chromosome partitioning protein